jgi:hypothetical protein
MSLEQIAREEIDRLLVPCGRGVHDYGALNLTAAPSAQTIGFFNRNVRVAVMGINERLDAPHVEPAAEATWSSYRQR